MQNVAGVVAVDLDNLYRSDTLPPAKRNDILFANAPTATDAAELLTLDVQPLNLKLMS